MGFLFSLNSGPDFIPLFLECDQLLGYFSAKSWRGRAPSVEEPDSVGSHLKREKADEGPAVWL